MGILVTYALHAKANVRHAHLIKLAQVVILITFSNYPAVIPIVQKFTIPLNGSVQMIVMA